MAGSCHAYCVSLSLVELWVLVAEAHVQPKVAKAVDWNAASSSFFWCFLSTQLVKDVKRLLFLCVEGVREVEMMMMMSEECGVRHHFYPVVENYWLRLMMRQAELL